MISSLERPDIVRADETGPHPKDIGQASTATRFSAQKDAGATDHAADRYEPWRQSPWVLPPQVPEDVRQLLDKLRQDPSVGVLEYGAIHLTVTRLPQLGATYGPKPPAADVTAKQQAASAAKTLATPAATRINAHLALKLSGMASALAR